MTSTAIGRAGACAQPAATNAPRRIAIADATNQSLAQQADGEVCSDHVGIVASEAEPMNGADNEVQQPNKTDLAAPAVLPLLPIAQAYARLLQHAGTDDKLATDLERLRHSHWTHWTAEENHVVATAVRVLRELNNWRLSNQPPKD